MAEVHSDHPGKLYADLERWPQKWHLQRMASTALARASDEQLRSALQQRKLARRLETAEELSEWFEYEPISGSLTWRKSPAPRMKAGAPAGTLKKAEGVLRVTLAGVPYQANRIAWTLSVGPVPEGCMVKPIDGDGTNLKLANLHLSAA
jgi:hypothetical protein